MVGTAVVVVVVARVVVVVGAAVEVGIRGVVVGTVGAHDQQTVRSRDRASR